MKVLRCILVSSASIAALALVASLSYSFGSVEASQRVAQQQAEVVAHYRAGVPTAYKPFLKGPHVASQQGLITQIDADVLITGIGDVISTGRVILDAAQNQILYAGPAGDAPAIQVNTTVKVPVVMPGLWDCHTHYGGHAPGVGFTSEQFPVNYMSFQGALQDLEETLMMGITSVREVGGAFGQSIHVLERAGQILAPNFHYSGRCIGITSGHTDSQLTPLDEYERDDLNHASGGAVCDGVPSCLRKMRENLRMQADVIKIMTTGGVLSEFDQPEDAELSPDEISAMVEDAKRAKRAVAAHAHGWAGIQNAIDNGVTSIEHGSYMTRDQARQIKAKSYMVYTPTITIDQLFFNGSERPAGLDDNQWRKGRAMLAHHSQAVQMAIEEKVPIVAGTDCPKGCALVSREINFLHMFGMTPMEAIRAATGDAPKCMGQFGLMPKSGRLEAGYEADVIGLSQNPLEDLEALTRKEVITHVWKGGNLLKSPGKDPKLHVQAKS